MKKIGLKKMQLIIDWVAKNEFTFQHIENNTLQFWKGEITLYVYPYVHFDNIRVEFENFLTSQAVPNEAYITDFLSEVEKAYTFIKNTELGGL